MNQADVQLLVSAHRREPRQVTTVAVALAMLAYRKQIGLDLRPAELVTTLGVSDSMARRAVRMAKALSAAENASDPRNLNVPDSQTERNLTVPPEPQRSGTSTFRPAEPQRSENGTSTFRIKEKELKESVCLTPARGEAPSTKPEPIPNGPSPEPERREVVRFVGDLTAGALESWASTVTRIYPAAWVRVLVERKVPGQSIPRATLLNSILQSWASDGECPWLAPRGPEIPQEAISSQGRPNTPRASVMSARDKQRAQAKRLIEEAEAREQREAASQ